MTCCNSRQKIPEVVALSLAHQIKTLQCALAAAFSLQGRGLEDAAAVVATSAMFAAVSVSPPGPLAPARPAAEMCSGLAAETWLVGTGKRLSREKTLGRALGTSGGQACPSVFSRLSRMPGPTSQASTHQVGSQQLLGLDRYHGAKQQLVLAKFRRPSQVYGLPGK
ncbi:MAG: hypothetical protein FRX49_07258 [Trebouxia sp. A1-2]|nr:MAG: hypothetical protein FRX49_07258 [Trebouxia sp. A1-2]